MQILTGFVVAQVLKMPHKDRKLVAVGLTRMLTESRVMLSEPTSRSWYVLRVTPCCHSRAVVGLRHSRHW